jgi:hypothetical protein
MVSSIPEKRFVSFSKCKNSVSFAFNPIKMCLIVNRALRTRAVAYSL